MTDKPEDKSTETPDSKKLNETFAPINATDRPATRNRTEMIRKRFGPRKIGLSIGFVILVVILGTLIFKTLTNKGEDSATNQVKTVLSSDEIKEYQSPENKFTIKFPGFPSISKKELKDGDKTIPQTIYEKRIENGNIVYNVEVDDYSNSGISLDEKRALEVRLNERIQNVPGSKLTSSKQGVYANVPATEAMYTFSEKGKNYEARARFLVKDSKIYTITLIGGDQNRYNDFANSLRFN